MTAHMNHANFKHEPETVSHKRVLLADPLFGELAETIRAAARPLFCFASLSHRLRVIDVHLAHAGPLASFLAPPADIFRQALRDRADLVALLHNHPSGNAYPSGEDEAVTGRVRLAGDLLGIVLYDHIIVAPDENTFGFFDSGLL